LRFIEDIAAKRSLSRRAWQRSATGRLGFWSLVILVSLSPLVCLLAREAADVPVTPWAMDVPGPLVAQLCGMVVPIVAGLAVRIETWRRCNMEIGMREASELRITGAYLLYSFRNAGDRHRGTGGRHYYVVSLPSLVQIGYDVDSGMVALKGVAYYAYRTDTPGMSQATPNPNEARRVYEVRIPNYFSPDLYQALLPYRR
jgi:hypothetical protein